MMRRRIERRTDLLTSIKDMPNIAISRIIYYNSLSHSVSLQILGDFVDRKLVVRTRKGKRFTYRITLEGIDLLKAFNNVKNRLGVNNQGVR